MPHMVSWPRVPSALLRNFLKACCRRTQETPGQLLCGVLARSIGLHFVRCSSAALFHHTACLWGGRLW